MSRLKYLRIVMREIDRLNDRIDRKIILGQPYGKDAKEHARLRALVA